LSQKYLYFKKKWKDFETEFPKGIKVENFFP